MNQSNYDNFNYDNYRAPKEGGVGGFVSKFKNPVFATAAILLAGAAFAGVIIASYPSSDDAGEVPIVQAETASYKEMPSDPGGMDVPFQDSTVYSSLRDADAPEVTSIESLLEEEEPVDRLEAFAAEAERIIQESEARRAAVDTASLIEEATGVDGIPEGTGGDTLDAVVARAEADKRIKQQVAAAPSEELMQKLDPVPSKPESLYKPGSSPDTIEFVRDVLEKKDAKETVTAAAAPTPAAKPKVAEVAKKVAAIEPASGGFDIRPGSHYVQLGSVKTAAGATSEWSKIQKKYPAELAGSKYRVERADLGDRGVFFRIQAGPMSKESASAICGSIKAQTPGGCLVTQ